MLRDKSQKAEAIFFPKYFWPHAQVGETGRKWNMMKCWHNTDKALTLWWMPSCLQENRTWPSSFVSHPALWGSYRAEHMCRGIAVSAQHLREFLIPWSIDLQESSTVILISHCCFNSATSLLSTELWEILSMFNCDCSKDLCEKVKVNDKVIEKIRHEKYLLQNWQLETVNIIQEKKMQDQIEYNLKVFLWQLF